MLKTNTQSLFMKKMKNLSDFNLNGYNFLKSMLDHPPHLYDITTLI